MLRLISDFIGHPLSDEKLNLTVRHCQFESMKDNFKDSKKRSPVSVLDNSKGHFMRKGIIGDWRNHFNEQESALFDDLYNDRLQAIGLDMAYDEEEARIKMEQNGGRIIRIEKAAGNGKK